MLEQDTKTLPGFTHSDIRISTLLDHLRQIADLQALGAIAEWDQNTAMPGGAAELRGFQVAALQGVLHELWSSPQLGNLLSALNEPVQQAPFTDADRGLVREAQRAHDRATKLPRKLVEELARVQATSFEAWRSARENSDFSRFAPMLSRTITLHREVADYLGFAETRYDALLNEYEPGMTSSKLDRLFTPVRETSRSLLQRIEASEKNVDASCLEGTFPVEQQMALCERLLRNMGYDFSRGQMAQSPHPFTTSFGSPFDVRLTVRPLENFLQASLIAAIHEGGHAVYEQGVSPTLVRTLLASGASSGAHESQSRLWENAIGRSEPFWQSAFAAVKEVFPAQFAHTDVTTFVRALNKVQPTLIRVEADEVTYNLHIIVRYELEKALINGEIAVETLPGLWNAKYREYLGIEPANDKEGVLQDIHWSFGFGYFPTYTLGNLYSAQIFHKLKAVFPDFDQRLAGGDTSLHPSRAKRTPCTSSDPKGRSGSSVDEVSCKEGAPANEACPERSEGLDGWLSNSAFALHWLREHMYTYGVIYLPETLIERITDEPPNPEHFIHYLNTRFEKIYDLPAVS